MKQPSSSRSLRSASRAVRALAFVAWLVAASAEGAEGDLDPRFGDVGRVGPIATVPGTAWAMHAMDDGSFFVGGGQVSLSCPSDIIGCVPPRYVGFAARSFLIHVAESGQLLESHEIAAENFHLLAIARQSDGRFVVAGRGLNERSLNSKFIVYRLNQDGSPDTAFGTKGLVQLPTAVRGNVDDATAVLVEPDGRIVVAGTIIRTSHRSEILIRLLPNGEFDPTFGSSGIVVLPGRETNSPSAARLPLYLTQVLRTDAGAYRVSVQSWCQLVGLTPDGNLDPAFGSSGTAQLHHPISNACSLMIAMQDDGRLVAGASDGEAAVVTRLLADGQPDPGFLAGTGVHDSLGYIISALAVGPDGSIVIALGLSDFGYDGLTIRRLRPNGEVYESFGVAGATEVEMPSEFGSVSLLFDMLARGDGSIVGVGGNPFASPSEGPIIVQLLGAGMGDSPGVLSFARGYRLQVNEELADVSVEVHRTGGDAGYASVAYQVLAGDIENAATAGEDYVADAGRLEWEDGDATTKQVRIRIIDDDLPEDVERITVRLTDPEGGAGLGQAGRIIDIRPNDGFVPPDAGVISLVQTSVTVAEGSPEALVTVRRTGGDSGIVGVRFDTVGVGPNAATARDDFTEVADRLSWSDGDVSDRTIHVPIRDDGLAEGSETFEVRLSEPIGATLGPNVTAIVTIVDDDAPGGSGGAFEFEVTASTGPEGTSFVLVVMRNGPSSGAASVDFTTSSGTATAGADFTSASGTLSWADGESVDKSIVILTVDDTTDEIDETFTVALSNPSAGATLGSSSTTTLTILDDDAPAGGGGRLEFAAPAVSVREGVSVPLVVGRFDSSAGAISVDYTISSGTATAGADFTSASGTLRWADGESVDKSIVILTVDDATDEIDETFTVALSNPSAGATLGSNPTTTVTITDDDAPDRAAGSGGGRGAGGAGTSDQPLLLGLVLLWLVRWRAMASGHLCPAAPGAPAHPDPTLDNVQRWRRVRHPHRAACSLVPAVWYCGRPARSPEPNFRISSA